MKISNIHFSYSSDSILKDVSFELQSGRCLWLRGPNGAGKTTLLKIIAGVLRPTSGQIISSCCSLFLGDQFFYEKMSLRENLTYYKDLQNSDQKIFDHLVAHFELASFWERPYEKLSRGEKARGALVRAFILEAESYLLDEPFSNLDEVGRDKLKQVISEFKARKKSLIIVSHQDFGIAVDHEFVLSRCV